MDLTSEVLFSLIQSEEKFPINFDDAWQWIEYSSKQKAEDKLIASFDKNIDYIIPDPSLNHSVKRKKGGQNLKLIYLTIDCFKNFCVMAGTPKGKEVRRFLFACQEELQRRLLEEKNQQQATTKHRLVGAIVSDKILARYPKFDDEFYELLYKKRGNGWENRDPKKRPVCVANWTNTTVYDRLYGGIDVDGVKAKLNEVNPTQENGRRKGLQHWHLKPLGEFHLSNHIAAVKAIARISPDGDWQRFLYNIRKGLPNGESLQLNLLEYADFLENSDMIEVL